MFLFSFIPVIFRQNICFIKFFPARKLYTGYTGNGYEVWALLSNIAHMKYPFCAKKCYVFPNVPFPCNQNPKNLEEGMNYRFTLINKRWIERTIDLMDRKKMSTTTCSPSTRRVITTDEYYDLDVYHNYREMMSNHVICKSDSDHNKPEAHPSPYFWVIVVIHIMTKGGGFHLTAWSHSNIRVCILLLIINTYIFFSR